MLYGTNIGTKFFCYFNVTSSQQWLSPTNLLVVNSHQYIFSLILTAFHFKYRSGYYPLPPSASTSQNRNRLFLLIQLHTTSCIKYCNSSDWQTDIHAASADCPLQPFRCVLVPVCLLPTSHRFPLQLSQWWLLLPVFCFNYCSQHTHSWCLRQPPSLPSTLIHLYCFSNIRHIHVLMFLCEV